MLLLTSVWFVVVVNACFVVAISEANPYAMCENVF